MAGVNKVIIIGNLGADPEIRHTPGGGAVANFRVAVNESWTDKQGQKQERTEWVRVVVWGKLAELCGEYLNKGRQVYVEGRMQTREWTDKEDRKQWTTEVVANSVTFLGGKDGGSQGGNQGRGHGGDDFGPSPTDLRREYGPDGFGRGGPADDDIPFMARQDALWGG